ncbi:MAG: hypothetical protein WCL14_10075 [Bacteroidota bacterium]
MKKLLSAIFVWLILVLESNGQAFYIGGGAGIGLNGSPIMTTSDYSNTGLASNFSLFGGYTFYKKQISFEVAYSHIHSDFAIGGDQTEGEYLISRNRIIPSIKLIFGESKTALYVKASLILDLPGTVQNEKIYAPFDTLLRMPSTNHQNGYVTKFTQGKATIGLPIVFGLNFKISESSSIFIEFNSSAYQWSPSHSEVIDGGGSDLSKFTVAQKQNDYVDNPVIRTDTNLPTEVSKKSYKFSNIGLNAGFIFHFGKKKEN